MATISPHLWAELRKLARKGPHYALVMSDLVATARPDFEPPKRGESRLTRIANRTWMLQDRQKKKVDDEFPIPNRRKTLGLFVLEHQYNRNVFGSRAYCCRCECGTRIYLLSNEALQRAQLGVGCMTPGCASEPVYAMIGYQVQPALALQLTQLVTLDHTSVDRRLRVLSVPDAVAALKPQPQELTGKWWIKPQGATWLRWDQRIDYMRLPPARLFPGGSAHLRMEGELLSIREAADTFACSEESLLRKKLTMWDDELIAEMLT